MNLHQNLQINKMGILRASHHTLSGRRLKSGIPLLDEALGGGLPCGAVTEWGSPKATGGRELLLSWLRLLGSQSQLSRALWVSSSSVESIYPPAWEARGVPLQRIRFAVSKKPLQELRPALLEGLFSIIILEVDRPLSGEEIAFLSWRARLQHQVIVILHDRFLVPGSAHSRLRLDCFYQYSDQAYHLHVMRGGPQGRSTICWDENFTEALS